MKKILLILTVFTLSAVACTGCGTTENDKAAVATADELVASEQAILEETLPEGNAIFGIVTDAVTKEPIAGATVNYVSEETTASVLTDETGAFSVEGAAEEDYILYAEMKGYEEGEQIRFTSKDASAETEISLRPDYAQAYADYLMENQERNFSSSEYSKGKGRFALAQMTDDHIPELLIIDRYDNALIYTYENGEVRKLMLSIGSTDIVRYNYRGILYGGEKSFAAKRQNGISEIWDILDTSAYPNCDFVLSARIISSDKGYFHNQFDTEKVYSESFDYVNSYKDNAVSETEYKACLTDYGLDDYTTDESDYKKIEESDVHYITPKEIKEIFVCNE